MASHRIGARVAGLSPEQLCAIIEAQGGASDAALRVAEEHAARLVAQPEWVLSEVLLSPDLVPHVLAQLPTTEHAIKGTCRAWRRGWKETLKKRERPRLVVFGGHSSGGEFVNSLERYDPSTNEWEAEAMAPMPTARGDVGTAVLDGKFYAVGGWEPNDGPLSSVERYDLATKAWEAVAPMATARANLAAVVLDGKLYAVGGYDSNDLSSVERYDPALNAWEAVAAMGTARQLAAPAVLDGKLYAVGGLREGSSLSSVERYDPAVNMWEAVAPMATAREAPAVAVLDGKLYAAGGYNINYGDLSGTMRPRRGSAVRHAVCFRRRGVGVGDEYDLADYDDDTDGPMNTVERYHPAANAWEAVAPMTMARRSPGVALLS